jgi:hypothetical protein
MNLVPTSCIPGFAAGCEQSSGAPVREDDRRADSVSIHPGNEKMAFLIIWQFLRGIGFRRVIRSLIRTRPARWADTVLALAESDNAILRLKVRAVLDALETEMITYECAIALVKYDHARGDQWKNL